MADITCKHGLKAVVKTSFSDEHPAMRFYGCPNVEIDECDFELWIDPDVTDCQREYIKKLKSERDDRDKELGHVGDAYLKMVISNRVSEFLARQYLKESDDFQQKYLVLESEVRALQVSLKQLNDDYADIVVSNFEMPEEYAKLSRGSMWKNYAIGGLLVCLLLLQR